jgi:hypothetical protein
MSLSYQVVADSLLYASIDGAVLALVVYLMCHPLQRRLPLACTWLWRLVFVKFTLGLCGIGILIGPERQTTTAPNSDGLPLLISGALLLGLLLGAERLCHDLRFLARLRHEATEPSPEWKQTWERICRKEGFVHPPRLLQSNAVELPLAAGIFRPIVVIPTPLSLEEADRERVIAHELAHLRHGDLWFGWLVALLEPIFFFHPLFWLARRELRLTQEMAADRRALKIASHSAGGYSRLLLTLSSRNPLPGAVTLGMGESFQMLRQRLEALPLSRRPADALRFALAAGLVLGLSSLSLAHRISHGIPVPKTFRAAAIAAPVAFPPSGAGIGGN